MQEIHMDVRRRRRKKFDFLKISFCIDSYIEPIHNIENANNICLPQSMRDKLKPGTVSGKVVLELKTTDGKLFHCGILDYTAKNNEIILPNWMMKHLMLQENSYIHVRTVRLPQCESIVFQPHSEKIYNFSNVALSLEMKLCHFIAVTEGQTIPFIDELSGEEFLLSITQTEPSSGVCLYKGEGQILELVLSFAPCLDSKDNIVKIEEPEDDFMIEENIIDENWVEPNEDVEEKEEIENSSGALIGRRSDEDTKTSNSTSSLIGKRKDDVVTKIEEKKPTENTTGGGRSLGGSSNDKLVDENNVKCEICQTIVAKKMFDIHTVHCKRRHGVK